MTLAIRPASPAARPQPIPPRPTPPSRPTVRIVARRSRYGTPGFAAELVFPDGRVAWSEWCWSRLEAAEFAVYLHKQRGADDWDGYLKERTYGEWKGVCQG